MTDKQMHTCTVRGKKNPQNDRGIKSERKRTDENKVGLQSLPHD